MTKGGYQILDLSGTNFETGVTSYVEGAHSKLESTRKVILVSGLTVDGEEYRDAFVDFTVNESDFVGTMHGKTITIGSEATDLDPITIT
jgi:hypothetical protein